MHCPFTPGICWVTIQGYVTLCPLNDASTCWCVREEWLLSHQTLFLQSHWIFFLLLGEGWIMEHACLRVNNVPKEILKLRDHTITMRQFYNLNYWHHSCRILKIIFFCPVHFQSGWQYHCDTEGRWQWYGATTNVALTVIYTDIL